MFNKKDNDKFGLYEYEKKGWTFHAKGVWLYENNEVLPSLTVIGSSNYSKFSFLVYLRLTNN